MKIRELASEWRLDARERWGDWREIADEATKLASNWSFFGALHYAQALDKALAELDAKFQDFDAYWREAYPLAIERVDSPSGQAVVRLLDALQVAFEVPTRKVEA